MPHTFHNIRLRFFPVVFLLPLLLTSCFTGIEGTKKITLSKADIKNAAPTEEELLLTSIHPSPNTQWRPRKSFYVSDARAGLLLNAKKNTSGDLSIHRGDMLLYSNSRTITAPDGRPCTALYFLRNEDEFEYIAAASGYAADHDTIFSNDIPGLIDPEMIRQTDELLRGRTLWTLTTLWLDESENRVEGRKFSPVTIDSVTPGNMVFPLSVWFHNQDGYSARFLLNFGSSGKDSRSFANLFSLSDPRKTHPSITPHVWDLITRGLVEPGMTREECRLAKGNPSDVSSGHDYSRTLLLWKYPDGNVLYFEDGILVGINSFGKETDRKPKDKRGKKKK